MRRRPRVRARAQVRLGLLVGTEINLDKLLNYSELFGFAPLDRIVRSVYQQTLNA